MSQVNLIGCPLCDPMYADQQGIRRTINLTSSELYNFIAHVISVHYDAREIAEAARESAEIALKVANTAAKMARESSDKAGRSSSYTDPQG